MEEERMNVNRDDEDRDDDFFQLLDDDNNNDNDNTDDIVNLPPMDVAAIGIQADEDNDDDNALFMVAEAEVVQDDDNNNNNNNNNSHTGNNNVHVAHHLRQQPHQQQQHHQQQQQQPPLPVAVPVRRAMMMEQRRRRMRMQMHMRRAFMARRDIEFGNNHDIDNDNDDDDDDLMDLWAPLEPGDEQLQLVQALRNRHQNNNNMNYNVNNNNNNDQQLPDVQALVPPQQLQPFQLGVPFDRRQRRATATGREGEGQHADPPSPFLLDLIREDLPCSVVLSGTHVRGCSMIVQRCQDFPTEVQYQCPRTGRTPLHEAAMRCCCRHVIQALMNVDPLRALHLDARQNTPLHLLFLGIANRRIQQDDMELIVDQLLQPMPSMAGTIRNLDGSLPIHCATAAPESMVPQGTIERLLQASPASASRTNNFEQTPLHLHCQRRNASRETAQLLLDAHAGAGHLRDRASGYTPLHYAAANSNHALIELLARADPLAATTRTISTEKTPLHIVCENYPIRPEDLSSVQVLLEVAPETAMRLDEPTRYTPLHIVCRSTRGVSLAVVQALVASAPATLLMRDHNQYVPLHHACEHGANLDVVACLLQANPTAATLQTRKNDTALSLACTANHSVETVQMLLQANPAAALQANDYGFLPLHCVCRAYQASTAIVQALCRACPQAVTKKTNAGELAMHLAGSNTGATSIGVLDVLTRTMRSLPAEQAKDGEHGATVQRLQQQPTSSWIRDKSLTSSAIGNTPLHLACFKNTPRRHIESLAESNPEWIKVRNNAGYTPLQILCKNGRIDDRIVTLFSRLTGPEIFASADLMGNTPLHSAMREETDLEAVRAIIRAYPGALYMKTTYDDTPLHLACLRKLHPDLVTEIALASSTGLEKALANCNGRISPMLIQNTAGQTPIGIAMEEYQRLCCQGGSCSVQNHMSSDKKRSFDTVAALAKMLHYGPSEDNNKGQSLVGACVALHRKGARIDPAFIHRALNLYPEEARMCDDHGNTPLHIEASIPVEKMSLLDASGCCRSGSYHKRMGVLRKLLEIYPEATRLRNSTGDFPLSLMIQNGRPWDSTFAMVFRTYPEAFHWVQNIDARLNPLILARIVNECGADTLYALLRSRPEYLLGR